MSDPGTLERLEAVIAARRAADPSTSYVAKLSARGLPKIAQKVGEEAVETVIAAVRGDTEGVVSESADLIYHWLVVLSIAGVPLSSVLGELERRTATTGVAEKASRKPG